MGSAVLFCPISSGGIGGQGERSEEVKELFFHFFSFNFPANGCNKHRHQRTQVVEEAIWQIGERGHPKHGRLSHAAGVPGYQNRSDRGGVFGGSA